MSSDDKARAVILRRLLDYGGGTLDIDHWAAGLYQRGCTAQAVADTLGITVSHVHYAVSLRRSVGVVIPPHRRGKRPSHPRIRYREHGSRVGLSPAELTQRNSDIRAAWQDGLSGRDISARFRISPARVSHIVHGGGR